LKIHCIGIGGIGISGLAQYLQHLGHEITGSDQKSSFITEKLSTLGMKIFTPHSSEAIENDHNLVIHSAIISDQNPEIISAKNKNIEILSRKEALKLILKDKKVFAVAGAHGKSTTSAILSSILNETSSIIGAYSKEFNSNIRLKDEKNIVFEADESDASFLNTNPYYAIVTNAEQEHMDYYKHDSKLFYESYTKFINQAKVAVLNIEDEFLQKYYKKYKNSQKIITLEPSEDIKNIEYKLINLEPVTQFELKNFGTFTSWGFGKHIAINTSLAILTALNENFSLNSIRENLKNYSGIKKRFDIIHKDSEYNFTVIDDYAHHPTEIKATMSSVLEYAKLQNINEIIGIWQPHKYSRTLDNIDEFKKSFSGVSRLVILPVWATNEQHVEIDFKTLFSHYNLIIAEKIERIGNKINIIQDNKSVLELSQNIVIGFGAGDITYQLRGE
jgi:UDP-N-acetylmuramate--alanine ligase